MTKDNKCKISMTSKKDCEDSTIEELSVEVKGNSLAECYKIFTKVKQQGGRR